MESWYHSGWCTTEADNWKLNHSGDKEKHVKGVSVYKALDLLLLILVKVKMKERVVVAVF